MALTRGYLGLSGRVRQSVGLAYVYPRNNFRILDQIARTTRVSSRLARRESSDLELGPNLSNPTRVLARVEVLEMPDDIHYVITRIIVDSEIDVELDCDDIELNLD